MIHELQIVGNELNLRIDSILRFRRADFGNFCWKELRFFCNSKWNRRFTIQDKWIFVNQFNLWIAIYKLHPLLSWKKKLTFPNMSSSILNGRITIHIWQLAKAKSIQVMTSWVSKPINNDERRLTMKNFANTTVQLVVSDTSPIRLLLKTTVKWVRNEESWTYLISKLFQLTWYGIEQTSANGDVSNGAVSLRLEVTPSLSSFGEYAGGGVSENTFS